jgi:two-component system phosphate regulon sensor histidine kinase PhoR
LNKKSIFLNILVDYFLLVFFVLCVSSFLFFNILKKEIVQSNQNKLLFAGETIQSFLPTNTDSNISSDYKNKILNISKQLDLRISLISKSGKVFFDTHDDFRNMDIHNNRSEVMTAFDGKIGIEERYSSTLKKNMLYVAVPVFQDKDVVFVVRVSCFLQYIEIFIKHLRNLFLIIFFGLIFVSLIFAFFSARKYSQPIQMLADSISEFGKGKDKKRLFVDSYKEVEDLTVNFNMMTDRVVALVKDLTIEKQKIKDIVDSIYVGIVAIDKHDNLIFYNKTFDDFLGHKNERKYIGSNYREYLREHVLLQSILKAKKNSQNSQNSQNFVSEIFFRDKFFICNITNVNIDNSLIVMLSDISSMKKLEQIKKDFVANVSHELRTPLASIKGFLETMQEDKEYNEDFVQIMSHNTERIIKIVNDLIALSKLENFDSDTLEIEIISISEIKDIIQNIKKIFEQDLETKGLSFDVSVELDNIRFDKNMFYTLLINLISNAVRYTDNGRISIKLWQEDDKKYIAVEDTGIGIDAKYLDRIFERFFVIDKARSKKTGGTGLGLSIVKHIVMLHSYNIKVSSDNSGTKFLVILKI